MHQSLLKIQFEQSIIMPHNTKDKEDSSEFYKPLKHWPLKHYVVHLKCMKLNWVIWK
jgi:hypothetical protein